MSPYLPSSLALMSKKRSRDGLVVFKFDAPAKRSRKDARSPKKPNKPFVPLWKGASSEDTPEASPSDGPADATADGSPEGDVATHRPGPSGKTPATVDGEGSGDVGDDEGAGAHLVCLTSTN